MNVRFRVLWHVVVKDVADAGHVQAACGNVRRDEDVQMPGFELLDRPFPNSLWHVAVECDGGEPFPSELFGNRHRRIFGIRKNDHAVRLLDFQQPLECVDFVPRRDKNCPLPSQLGRHRFFLNRDPRRIVQVTLCNIANRLRQRRREERDLSLLGCLVEHELNVVEEAHVQHLVGFVEYQAAQFAEVERTAFDVVDDSPRSSDDLNPAPQLLELSGVILSAINCRDGKSWQATAVSRKRFGDLDRQLARRGENQNLRLLSSHFDP